MKSNLSAALAVAVLAGAGLPSIVDSPSDRRIGYYRPPGSRSGPMPSVPKGFSREKAKRKRQQAKKSRKANRK